VAAVVALGVYAVQAQQPPARALLLNPGAPEFTQPAPA